MKRQGTIQAHRLEKFARFLEEHPGVSPSLMGEDPRGFQVGGSYLGMEEMQRLIATPPQSDGQEAALLPAPSGAIRTGGL